jgi:alpha-2-macroglobulin
VFHGFVHCGAAGAITGVGNCLPAEVLRLVELAAARPPATPRRRASPASSTTRCTCSRPSTRGPTWSCTTSTSRRSWATTRTRTRSTRTTRSSASQRRYVEAQLRRFQAWWRAWPGARCGAARGPFARLVPLALALALAPLAAQAQPQDAPIPERFATTLRGTDFPGNDLTPLFNVSLEQCHATCLRLPDCVAFTYDELHGACFPKGAVGESAPYELARSGVITNQSEAALARASEAAASLAFLDRSEFVTARDQAVRMAERYPAEGRGEAELLEAARAQPPAQAIATTGAAVTVADAGGAWLAHARALAATAAADADRRYDLNQRAASAALNAALRLDEAERAPALLVLARALEATFRGDAALRVLRVADALRPGIAPDDLARLWARFGFRLLAHDVDASSAAPRICLTFSEALSPTRDYGPFVRTDATGLALEVEGSQACLTGVAYGERYAVTLRAGLPAVTGDALPRDVPLEVYVRDRAPSVRFPGRTYVLPAAGPRAVPVETVNADLLALRLLRVSDRNLVNAIREGSFAQALSAWEGERFEALLARASGRARRASRGR